MAKYRQLQTCYWKDILISGFTSEEKLLYVYLLTNENTTQCGIYEFRLNYAHIDTGLSEETIERLLQKFIDYGIIKFCSKTKEIMIVNWLKYNFIKSNTVINCINKELNEVKNSSFINELFLFCKNRNLPIEKIFNGIDTLSIGSINHSEVENIPYGEEEEIEEEKEVEVEAEIEKAKAQAETALDIEYSDPILKVFETFNNNIHMITPLERERLIDWSMELDHEVIIAAIEEAVRYDVRTMAYIERVLHNWYCKGITTMEGVNACQRAFNKKKAARKEETYKPNSKAYMLFEDGENAMGSDPWVNM